MKPLPHRIFPVLALIVALTACQTSRPRYVIGVSQCSNDAWREKMNNEMLTEALLYDDVIVEIRSAEDNNNRQIADIRSFIDRGVDLLVVAPNEAIPVTPVVEEAFASGIPVIVVDRKILSDHYTAYIGADNYQIGKVIGEYVAAHLDGCGKVIELTGLGGSTPAIDRHQGFLSVINRFPDIRLLCSEDARWQQEVAERKTDSLCWLYPDTDLLFAHNDAMAYGAYLAARRALANHKIDFIGIDGLPGPGNGIDRVKEHVFDATFIYPTGGDRVIATAMNILTGQPYERETLLSTAIVDSSNATVLEMQTQELLEQQNKINFFKSKVNNYLLRYSTQLTISWFSIVCLLLIAVILLLVWRSFRAKSRLNHELMRRNDEITSQKERLEEQRDMLIELSRQLEEATQAKLVFFTNVSHDFRTPLTLIADPVEHLLTDDRLTDDQRFYLQMARKNAQILLRMVNQILDFRKYENGKLELSPARLDLHASMLAWNASFRELALRRKIRFGFSCTCRSDFYTVADGEKIERAYYNLLSNALKFTPAQGFIQVSLTREPTPAGSDRFRLCVTNSGSYIAPEQAARIFDRFYQTDRNNAGSGIGLALAKVFVEMHGGTIGVESSHDEGTTFTILLPAVPVGRTVPGCDVPPAAETAPGSVTVVPAPDTVAGIGAVPEACIVPAADAAAACVLPSDAAVLACGPTQTRPGPPDGGEMPCEESFQHVLIIDDNHDIRAYLRRILGDEFVVSEACDGDEGFANAVKSVPDVIVSDVMMPRSDGITCCNRLKQELSTCHIPIVLLTACSLDEQRIEGLRSGADAYLAKPFNAEVLIATIHSLLENRAKLRQYYGDNRQPAIKGLVNDMDKDFMARVRTLIEENIDNPDFNVEEFGRSVGMSHAQLYRKIKALTDYSPNEYVRVTRLRQAAVLLSSSELTIAEAAYRVGFSSPSYFAKCFRRLYGETPADYQKRNRHS